MLKFPQSSSAHMSTPHGGPSDFAPSLFRKKRALELEDPRRRSGMRALLIRWESLPANDRKRCLRVMREVGRCDPDSRRLLTQWATRQLTRKKKGERHLATIMTRALVDHPSLRNPFAWRKFVICPFTRGRVGHRNTRTSARNGPRI